MYQKRREMENMKEPNDISKKWKYNISNLIIHWMGLSQKTFEKKISVNLKIEEISIDYSN